MDEIFISSHLPDLFGAYPASYPMDIWGFFPGDKGVWVRN
jgi:hypothetical protein